ncbi:peptide chain release factor N(5)-glutamine methyltransferase [Belliella pelovolcani]|uniref:Release factor glutamine methyltransferase n=1 Tax=Belliella pelovolcani TaxID=529505 RepID=A0A1N7JX52_9BACT|nr:peptide chain release factor N(5)-glutamine methyltransferase [Belliella pelovolcani]SIS53929.1 release factor glutamine methyltransferase [Belliella pelovolcani]
MTTLRQLYRHCVEQLETIYDPQEAESLSMWLLEELLSVKRFDILKDIEIQHLPDNFDQVLEQLLQKKPIQYIFEKAPFYGRDFYVNENVLIPRNETEELVHLIIQENKELNLRVLDIGTGSGCIPISLALEIPSSKVFALDISELALEVAQRNANTLEANIELHKIDILAEDIPVRDLDIIVSNPPYVCESEKNLMHDNVLQYEPHLALFVTDQDPLQFYRIIATKAKSNLKPGGKLYFEINEALGIATRNLLESLGYQDVKVLQDLNGKDRMVKANIKS